MFRTIGLIALPAVALLAACAVGPDYRAPETKLPPDFANAAPALYATSSPERIESLGRLFADPTLDALVAEALEANHDIRIAVARVAEARAFVGESRLDLAPTVTATGGYTERRLSRAEAGPALLREQSIYDSGFDAIWELDFFGRVRRGIEASRAELEASEASLADAQLIVVAEVTRNYFELRGAQQQLDVARRNVANQTETLELTDVRLEAGRGTELDTSRARAQLSATLATIAPLETGVARAIHRLGVLVGRDPAALGVRLAPAGALPALPGLTPVGDPAQLLRRRPDVRVAERELAAATARIGVAVADLFPRVAFTGSVGYAGASADDLGDAGTGTSLVAPGITWAAFDLGRVRARIAAARARADASLARYERTVLEALEETENALVAHARARERLVYLEEAAAASATAAQLARLRFEGGATDFLQVLDAERTLLDAEDRLAASRTDTVITLVAVYKALGGGWGSASEPR